MTAPTREDVAKALHEIARSHVEATEGISGRTWDGDEVEPPASEAVRGTLRKLADYVLGLIRDEREECEKVCDERAASLDAKAEMPNDRPSTGPTHLITRAIEARECAAAIRSRGAS